MTTVPDIPVVQLPAFESDAVASDGSLAPPASIWAVEVPHGRRITPVMLAALGVVAGIASMAVGAAAVISAASTDPRARVGAAATTAPDVAPAVAAADRRVLALLAKPSTERIAFRGAPGLVLAVGSGGRAAILVRGLKGLSAQRPSFAWVIVPGTAPIRAARLTGAERTVFLAPLLGPRASVVISPARPDAASPARNRIVALRS